MVMTGMSETLDGFRLVCGTESASAALYIFCRYANDIELESFISNIEIVADLKWLPITVAD